MDFSQFSGVLVFLFIFTIGFWLMIFALSFVVPYWLFGSLKERFDERKSKKKEVKTED